MRAVVGGSSFDWYGAAAGGIAYTNTFGQAYYEVRPSSWKLSKRGLGAEP